MTGVTGVIVALFIGRAAAAPRPQEVPDFKLRVQITAVDGQAPAAADQYRLTMTAAEKPVTFGAGEWSPWLVSAKPEVAKVLKAYPNTLNRAWQVKVACTIRSTVARKPFAPLTLRIETAIENGETSSSAAELFAPTLGVLLWKSEGQVHIDTLAGHGRRVYEAPLREAMLAPADRPHHIVIGDRYIGGDSDLIAWREGIARLAGLGINALHPTPPGLAATVREAGINKVWGGVYSPPGYAFNFKDDRQAEFTAFVQKQIKGALDAGWKKEEIAYWTTSDEPGWYYPRVYNDFNQNPAALAAFHTYLQGQGLTPQEFGKATWDEVQLIGRKQFTDLAGRRLFYWSNRFVPWASARFFGEVTRAYEKEIYQGVPVLVNFNNFMGRLYQPGAVGNNKAKDDPNAGMGQHDWLEFGRERGATGQATEDWFGDNNAAQWSFYASKMRAAAALGGGGTGALMVPRVGGQRPMGMAQKLLALVGNGVKTISLFVYGPEYNFPVNCYSENIKVYKPLATGIGLIAKAEDLLYPGQARQSEVAILAPQSAGLWDLDDMELPKGIHDGTNVSMFRARMAYESEVYGLFRALQHSAIPVWFVDEKKLQEPDFGRCKVLYVTEPDIPAETMEAVLQWVRAGGTLVTVAGSAIGDRYHQPLDSLFKAAGAKPAHALRPLTAGIEAGGFMSLADKTLQVSGPHEKLQVEDARVLANFEDNTPALIEKQLGRGRILRFACFPGLSYHYALSARMPAVAEPGPVPEPAAGDTPTATPLAESPAATATTLPNAAPLWRDLIARPVHESGAALPVTVDQPMIEAPALYSDQGVAVTLLNWGPGAPETEVSVRVDRPVKRVESVVQGDLPFRTGEGRITVRLPLAEVDVLKVRY